MYLRIAAATLLGLLACGLPLWPIPYRQVSMPGNPSAVIWLGLGALAAFVTGYLIRRGLIIPVLSIVAGFILAVGGRVAVETTRDPTSHNLWPFEVVIAAFFGFVAACVGVGVARALQRVSSNRRA